MSQVYVYLGSFGAALLLMLLAGLVVGRAIRAENAAKIEDWER